MEELLGYPLDMAEDWLQARGMAVEIIITQPLRPSAKPTQLRVVQVKPGILVVAPFPVELDESHTDAGSS